MTYPPSNFEAMPLELHVNVLSHMSTIEDVLATIRASPAALSAFMTGPERIYAAVLEAGLAPEVFRELLAIVNAPDHNKWFVTVRMSVVSYRYRRSETSPSVGAPQSAGEFKQAYDSIIAEWDAWGRNAYNFLQSHARGTVYATPNVKMDVTKFKAQIRFMVKLYLCLCKFVEFYPTFVRSNAAGTRPIFPSSYGLGQQVEDSQEWPRLTDVESLRLQRGLLRYELFCRLVGLPSIAASCNRDVCDAVITRSTSMLVTSRLWARNPLSNLLPIDEAEEIICVSLYIRDMYASLRRDVFEEFNNHILDLNRGRVGRLLDKDGSDETKTAEYWLSQTPGHMIDFTPLKSYYTFDWTESVSRLGLVFLDRVTRSALEERRTLMQSAFSYIAANGCPHFLWRFWNNVVTERSTAGGLGPVIGPHCSPIIRDSSIMIWVVCRGKQRTLRRLGWVFFDDEAKLRSLGLPDDARASSIRKWAVGSWRESSHWSYDRPDLSNSASNALFTREEWEQFVMKRYSLKDHRDDYKAMSQFAAGARAVVDFTSNHLPHID